MWRYRTVFTQAQLVLDRFYILNYKELSIEQNDFELFDILRAAAFQWLSNLQ